MKNTEIILVSMIVLLFPSFLFASFAAPPVEETVSECMEIFSTDNDGFHERFDLLDPYQQFSMFTMCNLSCVYGKLDSRAKNNLSAVSGIVAGIKKELEPAIVQQSEQMAKFMNYQWQAREKEPPGEQEITKLDTMLKKRWADMITSLAANNIEEAVEYCPGKGQDSIRKMFQSLSEKTRNEIGKNMKKIRLLKFDKDTAYYLPVQVTAGTRNPPLVVYKNMYGYGWTLYSFPLWDKNGKPIPVEW
ncbi:MAG: hypothetical protein L3J49_06625 [Desulfobulbaceae bacterium]|nr:hypothetical protein [Desulfobulbaceae bacterium]